MIEAKWCGEKLEKHDSQLFRYFGTSKAKFAILTNGIVYRFFTDIDEKNKMDEKPFLEINMLDLKESHINELRKFCKDKFDVANIFNSASELKYTTSVKQNIINEFSNPSDQLVKILISDIYEGVKTQKVVDEFKQIVKKSFTYYVNELISERLKNALDSEKSVSEVPECIDENYVVPEKIVTTEEEIQAFYIVKSILNGCIAPVDVTYKDTESYLGILYRGNIRKWICRLRLGEKTKTLILPCGENKTQSLPIENIDSIYNYKDLIIESAVRFQNN